MESNSMHWMKTWGWIAALAIVLIIIAIASLVQAHNSALRAMNAPSDLASTTLKLPALGKTGTAAGTGASAAPTTAAAATPNKTFTDSNWSLRFTLRPEWNVNEFLDNSRKLHQMQISGTTIVIFISKDEAIGLSSDLSSTVAMQTIAGQQVQVRTYSHPSATFAYYQLFTVTEPDGKYAFLIKSATADTTKGDAFIRSISK
jgi:hypothetical protein